MISIEESKLEGTLQSDCLKGENDKISEENVELAKWKAEVREQFRVNSLVLNITDTRRVPSKPLKTSLGTRKSREKRRKKAVRGVPSPSVVFRRNEHLDEKSHVVVGRPLVTMSRTRKQPFSWLKFNSNRDMIFPTTIACPCFIGQS